MKVQTYSISLLNFVTKDTTAEVIGYLNLPPCNNNSKQYPIYVNEAGEYICIFNGEEKKLLNHLSIDDRFKITQVLEFNDWDYQTNSAVVELIDWHRFLVKK